MNNYRVLDEGTIGIIAESNPGDFAIYKIENGRLIPLFSSDSLAEMSGMGRDEYNRAVMEDANLLVLSSDRENVRARVADVVRNGGDGELVYRVYNQTEGSIWVKANARIIGTYENCPVMAVTYSRTSSAMEGPAQLLDLAGANIYVVDLMTHEMLYANGLALKYWGQSDYAGKSCYEFISGRNSACPWCSISRMVNGEYHSEAEYVARGDRWLAIDCIEMDWYGRKAAAIYMRDVTRMHKKQELLESDKNETDTIIGSIPGGIAVFSDRNGRLRLEYTNDGFYRLHCGSRKYWDAVSDDPAEWLIADDRHLFEDEFREVNSGNKTVGSVSYRVLGEDGRRHWVNNQFKYAYEKQGIRYYYASFVSLDDEKKIEQEVLKTQKMYDDATRTAKLIIWTYDAEKHCAVMLQNGYTRTVCESLGIPEVIENVPQSLLPYVKEEDRGVFRRIYEDIDSGCDEASGDFRFQMPAQEEMQFERMILKRIRDDQGEVLTVYGYGQNITALKQKEEKFNRAYVQLDNPNSYGSFHLNLSKNWCGDGKKGSSQISSVLKLQKSASVDGYFDDFSQLIDDEEIRAKFHGIFNREILLEKYKNGIESVSIEYPVLYANGERHWREGFLDMMENPYNGDLEAVTYSFDIDKRKRDEQIVDRLININFDYIGLIHLATGTFEFVSRKPWVQTGETGDILDYEECRRYVSSGFIEHDELEYFLGITAIDNIAGELASNDTYISSYTETKGGRISCARLEYCWLDNSHRDILVLRSDITELYENEQRKIRELNKARIEAEKASSAKTDFVSRISHDIRTPISAIIGMTQFAKEDIDDKDKLREDIGKIEASNTFLLSLINDILDISKIDSGKIELYPEPYPFDEYIEKVRSMFEPLCGQHGLKFNIEVRREAGTVAVVDKVRLNQITMNLLSNAVKYTPAGGTVTYISESRRLDGGMVRCKFIVKDTGIGMSEEFQKTMFDPFAQENNPDSPTVTGSGTGLGLSIVKRIIDLMGGTIEVNSRQGEGTAVTVTLDLPQAEPAGSAGGGQKAGGGAAEITLTRAAKFMLVDDNIINREIAVRILGNMGATVDQAENGAVAAEMFAQSGIGEYDAVLMDIQMPVMNGYESAEAIRVMEREDAKTVPIIAMTADAFAEAVQRSREAGMNDYITKPIDRNILVEKLNKWIG
ncbi:MAG: ATP-binding protein [Eubacteriaceae bacterium]|jgi:signal transduction histidine kinase/CheY-like chemotaxis protein|nr:ATP-binding protein [Eubacteriaceae bacterium]